MLRLPWKLTDFYIVWFDLLGCGFREKWHRLLLSVIWSALLPLPWKVTQTFNDREKWHRLLLTVIRSTLLPLPWKVTQTFTDCDSISYLAASMTSDTDFYWPWFDQLSCRFHDKWHGLLLTVIRSDGLRLPWQVTQTFTDCDSISWVAASMASDTDFYLSLFDQLGCSFHNKWHWLLLTVIRSAGMRLPRQVTLTFTYCDSNSWVAASTASDRDFYLLWFDQLGCGFHDKRHWLLLTMIRSARLRLPWQETLTFTYYDSIS